MAIIDTDLPVAGAISLKFCTLHIHLLLYVAIISCRYVQRTYLAIGSFLLSLTEPVH